MLSSQTETGRNGLLLLDRVQVARASRCRECQSDVRPAAEEHDGPEIASLRRQAHDLWRFQDHGRSLNKWCNPGCFFHRAITCRFRWLWRSSGAHPQLGPVHPRPIATGRGLQGSPHRRRRGEFVHYMRQHRKVVDERRSRRDYRNRTCAETGTWRNETILTCARCP